MKVVEAPPAPPLPSVAPPAPPALLTVYVPT
jgi:hypothetical protein